MKNILIHLTIFTLFLVTVNCQTKTRACRGSRALDPSEVSIKGCSSGICKLKRKTNAEINIKLIPERTIKTLTTNVNAVINNLPVPFIGVDGQSACNNMFDEEGNKVSCPLMKGKTYIYKNAFPVLEIYPKLQFLVHWALRENNRNLACFEVHARIV